MISGGRILWNAIAVCEMTKTYWQTGNIKMNEDLGIFLGHALFAGEFGKKIFWMLRFKIWKVGCIRNIFQKIECERSHDNPRRWRIFISCGRWFSQVIRKRLRIPRTHSETATNRKEREFQRKISRRLGRVSFWRKRRWRRRSERFMVYSRILHLLSSYGTESSTYVLREESFFL